MKRKVNKTKNMVKSIKKSNHNLVTIATCGVGALLTGGAVAVTFNKINKLKKKIDLLNSSNDSMLELMEEFKDVIIGKQKLTSEDIKNTKDSII